MSPPELTGWWHLVLSWASRLCAQAVHPAVWQHSSRSLLGQLTGHAQGLALTFFAHSLRPALKVWHVQACWCVMLDATPFLPAGQPAGQNLELPAAAGCDGDAGGLLDTCGWQGACAPACCLLDPWGLMICGHCAG